MSNLTIEGRIFSLDVQKLFDLELEDASSLIYHVKAIPTAWGSAEFRRCFHRNNQSIN